MNHNQLLGVAPGASQQEIQTAFRKKALEHHPDVSASPEAAEAFMRIKEARDELMKHAAETTTERDAQAVQHATDAAVRATTNAAYGQNTAQKSTSDDLFDGMTPQEIVYIQELDRLAMQMSRRGVFGRRTESPAVAAHRKKLQTNNDRLSGKY